MATEQFKAEVDAIGVVLLHLEPLSGPARERVIEYVSRALEISHTDHGESGVVDGLPGLQISTPESPPNGVSSLPVQDIRSLHDEKQPKTTIEMAAIVGYYLGELVPEGERKDSIETADVERYFKLARYPLPTNIRNILGNAAAAGYFDQAGRGRYRLNPVGHNLVVHNLPSSDTTAQPRRRPSKKAPAKKTAAKKAPAKRAAAKKTTS